MKIIKLLIIFYLSIISTLADQVDNIEVFGNQRISASTIKVLSNLSIDQNYTSEDLNLSFKKLYDTNFFKDIKFEIIDKTLNIFVEENPIIEDIQIEGLKNNNLEKFIIEKMVLKNRMSFTNLLLQKDINLIQNVLKTNGFYFSKINSSISENKEVNSIQIKLDIDKGERAKIKRISFIGDKKIKDKKLLEIIASEEHKFWKFISNKVYINEETINLDKRLLENFYKNLGYFKVEVLDSFAQFNNELGHFELIYNINAGEKFFFNAFSINLPDDYNLKDFNKVIKIFDNLKGENYSLDGISLILNQIDEIASSRLYDFIDADVQENIIDQNKINFTFNVKDSKKSYVEKINIIGNYTTIEEVIRNRFIVDEGDPLNALLFNKSIDNIKSLGIFKNVKSDIKDGADDLNKVIDIIVEEQPTGEISLAAGVGTSGSTLGGGIAEKNFLGKGINLATNLEISEDGLKGQFKYSKPNFAYTDNTLFTSVQSTTKDLLSDFGYEQSDINFSVGTSFQQYENFYFSPEIDISLEELKTNSNASESLKKQEGSYTDLYFNYGIDFDKRNSSFNPSSGNQTSFYQELPLVSGNNEISNAITFTQYKYLNKDSGMIGKASVYLKAINSLDSSDVRISKRANIPYNRMRGFEKGKVGPVDKNKDYIGGNYVSALNLSTNLPNILGIVENVDFKYFIDIANVWGVDFDSSIDDSNFIRSATGVGMDILTPIGPLSFSFSQPITKKSTDKTESFRFNIGTTF